MIVSMRNNKQDAREAMGVVFSVLTKRICMHKTKFLMNIFKYCFKNYIKLHELAIVSDIYYCTTYKYINFQQNRVSRSVKIVHTNVFAKNHKLHKFAITNSEFK